MRAIIIYCSEYKKNTEKVARVFAEKTNAELINIRDLSSVDLDDYDLIGLGSGVYKESMSPKVFKLVEKLNFAGKNVFVFSTSGIGVKFYNNKLRRLLASKGAILKGSFACKGILIAREFSKNKLFDFVGRLSQGHPNDKDLKEAERFIDRVISSL